MQHCRSGAMMRDHENATEGMEPLPMMLWRARPDMSCEYLSPAWLDFTGYSAEQALGDGWARGVHPEDLARWLDTCLSAFDLRRPFEIEYRLRRRDGAYRWILDRGVPRFSPESVFAGFVGSCLDIHERKRAEQDLASALQRERRLRTAAEESSRLKDGFLAMALRQLRAPLLDGVRVLIVDQDPAARESMSKVLGVAGAQTRGAASAQEAVQAFGAFRPDVLLSDVGMRGDDGYVRIRSVRSEEGVRAVAAGYHAQLAKPVEPAALLATVARLAQPARV